MKFLNDSSLVLYSSSYIPLLSVLTNLIQQQTITSILMIFNFSYRSQAGVLSLTSLTLKTLKLTYPAGYLPISCLLILLKLSFSTMVYHKNSLKINNPTIHLPNNVILSPVDSASNLGVIFDKHLSFAQHISAVSKSCFHNIRDLRRIRNTIDQTTVCIICTSLIDSKIDYFNSLLLNLPATQPNCLQLVH